MLINEEASILCFPPEYWSGGFQAFGWTTTQGLRVSELNLVLSKSVLEDMPFGGPLLANPSLETGSSSRSRSSKVVNILKILICVHFLKINSISTK